MASEVQIVIKVNQQGAEAFKQTSDGLEKVKNSAKEAGTSLMNIKAGFDIMKGAVTTVANMVSQVNELGVSSLRAKYALDVLSGGKAVEYLDAMRVSTHGLVDDMTLAQQSTKALTLHLVSSADQMASLAKAGAILGNTMGVGAAQGVETLTLAMSRVGLTGLLDNIGLSGAEVKNRFHELQATLGDQQAWSTAVLENAATRTKILEGSLEGVGSAADRVSARWNTFWQNFSARTATGIDAILKFNEATYSYGNEASKRSNQPGGTLLESLIPGFKNPLVQEDTVMLMGKRVSAEEAARRIEKAIEAFKIQNEKAVATGQSQAIGTFGGAVTDRDSTALTDRNGKSLEMIGGFNDLLKEGVGIYHQLEAGAQRVVGAIKDQVAAQRQFNSIQESTGTTSGGIGGELQGNMTDAFGNARDAREKADRRRGMSKRQIAADLAGFDAQQQQAMDAYALAVGTATPKSLALRDATAGLNKAFEAGKMGPAEYGRQLLELQALLANTSTTMGDFTRKQMDLTLRGMSGKERGGTAGKSLAYDMRFENGGPSGMTAPGGDPMEKYNTALDTARGKQAELSTAGLKMSTDLIAYGKSAAQGLLPISTYAQSAAQQVASIGHALQGLVGTLTINVGFSGAPAGGGGKALGQGSATATQG